MPNLNYFCLDYKDFSSNYKLIRKSKETQLGEIQLMKHKPSGKIVQVKEQIVENEDDLNELLASLEAFLPFNECVHFIEFLGFSIRQSALPAKPFKSINQKYKWSVYMIYEYIEHDLEKEVGNQIKKGTFFQETFLWKILEAFVSCLELLQKFGKRIGDIRPCNAYLSKPGELIKILYTNYAKTPFDLINAKKVAFYSCFLSPEQLEMVGEKRPNEKNFDVIKCEIFSVAAMLLSVACFQNSDRIYNYQEPGLLYAGINSKLSWMKANYSNILSVTLERMLSLNDSLRPSLPELLVYINRAFKNQSAVVQLPSDSSIPKFHSTFNSFDSNTIINSGEKNNLKMDSLSFQRMLNDSKSTKRTDKTNISICNSKEIIQLDSSLQRSLELINNNNLMNSNNNLMNSQNIEILEKDLKSKGSLEGSEKKIPFFEKVKKSELIAQNHKSTTPFSSNHKRIKSELPPSIPKSKQAKPRSSQHLSLVNSLETSLEDETRIQKLIRKLEKRLIYEKSNPTVLNPNMQRIEYSDGSLYIGMTANSLKEGKGIYYFSGREVYGGEWRNDRFEGHGVYIYDNGDIYEGSLKEGLKHGKGIYYYINGDKYDGEWLENQKNGFGVFYFSNGTEKFEGFWSNNEKNGPGLYYFTSGDRFEGTWKCGLKCGKGVVHFADNSSFEGVWEDNMPQGHGVLRYSNGDLYEGTFSYGAKEGEGVYLHGAGFKYQGTFKNDEPTGKGLITYSNGDKYQGMLMSGRRCGFGVYWYRSGEKYEGQWNQNQRWGNGKLTLSKGSYYEGNWKQGKRDGYGIMVYENGERYEGSWKEDLKEGKGAYAWKNGATFQGEWKNDKMNGEGRYRDQKDCEIFGLWLNGEFWEEN